MENVFKFIVDARRAFIDLVDGLSIEELNLIPEGFNNNIIWNFGHIVVSTQTLSYVRTGIYTDTSDVQFVDSYKKGSKPSYFVGPDEIETLKTLAIATIKRIEEDYKKDLFRQIEPFSTSTYGKRLESIEEILITSIGHDNLHFGYAQAQRKALKKQELTQ